MITATISELEREHWTPEIGRDINDPSADNYRIVQTDDALSLVMCSSVPYSGWLAKQVSPLIFQSQHIKFAYTMMIDDATKVCAQVAETDCKLTDNQGWTYDCSAQWEMVKSPEGWMFQIDGYDWKWLDTGIVIPASEPYEERQYEIEYQLDYVNKSSAIISVTVDGTTFDVPDMFWWIPAKQVGWAHSEIVTQLQQCNNHEPGGYTLRFPDIGYTLS